TRTVRRSRVRADLKRRLKSIESTVVSRGRTYYERSGGEYSADYVRFLRLHLEWSKQPGRKKSIEKAWNEKYPTRMYPAAVSELVLGMLEDNIFVTDPAVVKAMLKTRQQECRRRLDSEWRAKYGLSAVQLPRAKRFLVTSKGLKRI